MLYKPTKYKEMFDIEQAYKHFAEFTVILKAFHKTRFSINYDFINDSHLALHQTEIKISFIYNNYNNYYRWGAKITKCNVKLMIVNTSSVLLHVVCGIFTLQNVYKMIYIKKTVYGQT